MLIKLPVQPQLEMFKTVLSSFINPQLELCLFAKEPKQYEYGKRSSLAYTRTSGITGGAKAVDGNIYYNGRALKPQLAQIVELTGGKVRKAIVDKG